MKTGPPPFDPLALVYVQMGFNNPKTEARIRDLWQTYQRLEAGQRPPRGDFLVSHRMAAQHVLRTYNVRIGMLREKYACYGDQEFLTTLQELTRDNELVRLGVIHGGKCMGVFTFHPYFALCTAFFFSNFLTGA